MGTEIGDLLEKQEIEFEGLHGKKIAIDAYNTLYQFLSIIRQPNGTPLKDSKGRTTSHFSGLFYRTINLFEKGLEPIFVFDGKPPELKNKTLKERKNTRKTAKKEWKEAKQKGKDKEAYKKAIRSSKLNKEMVENSKQLLDYMGVPYVQAPSEGEAQAAHMVKEEDSYAVGSQDFDSLLFGSPYLIKNLTITGKRKLPGKDRYVEVNLERFNLEKSLNKLEITKEQLIEIAILIGTDYNEGIKGIGPKTALKKIKEHQNIDTVLAEIDESIDNVKEIKQIFLNPKISEEYEIEWNEPKNSEMKKFLCDERDFSENRVNKGIKRLEKSISDIRNQATLDSF
ncbi:flap endonuclease-1 [archaeon SCG-AAA382B04]|nr:flap endonuclease-1 [archaeon SCG-AAA382B04]